MNTGVDDDDDSRSEVLSACERVSQAGIDIGIVAELGHERTQLIEALRDHRLILIGYAVDEETVARCCVRTNGARRLSTRRSHGTDWKENESSAWLSSVDDGSSVLQRS